MGVSHWNEVNSGVSPSDPSFPDPNFNDVYFVNNNLGFAIYRDFAVGDGVIKTTDGGTMWSPLNISHDKYDKQYIYFADENLGLFQEPLLFTGQLMEGIAGILLLCVGYNTYLIS